MIKKYIDFVNEKLGVPEGNIEGAENIYDDILYYLKRKGNDIIDKSDTYEIEKVGGNFIKISSTSVKIGDIEFKDIKLLIEPLFNDDQFELAGMAVAIDHSDVKLTHFTYEKDNISNLYFILRYAVIEGKTTYEDIINHFNQNKTKVIGSLAHELKHIYDKFMIGKKMFGEVSSYTTFSTKRFGIDAIDRFIYLLYLTTKTESLVRSSEIAAQIKDLDVSKDEFNEFLKGTTLYDNIKMARDFSFEEMKKELYNDIDTIKFRLEQNNLDYPDNNDELVDFMLELTWRNIVGGTAETLVGLMNLDNPIRKLLGLIKKEEEDYFNKYFNKPHFKNKEKYFEYCEKMINFEANKVLKKISKLYDMCKDKEVSALHTKITDKSIINPKVHDKLVADKSIKSYESFFPKK